MPAPKGEETRGRGVRGMLPREIFKFKSFEMVACVAWRVCWGKTAARSFYPNKTAELRRLLKGLQNSSETANSNINF